MGLRSLHEVGIVHHNVSPNTIIFDRYGHVVLSGMEYSSLQSGGKCLHDIPNIEDKGYQAPELLSGWNHNILVDSWSFGMVLYFMFHGKVGSGVVSRNSILTSCIASVPSWKRVHQFRKTHQEEPAWGISQRSDSTFRSDGQGFDSEGECIVYPQ